MTHTQAKNEVKGIEEHMDKLREAQLADNGLRWKQSVGFVSLPASTSSFSSSSSSSSAVATCMMEWVASVASTAHALRHIHPGHVGLRLELLDRTVIGQRLWHCLWQSSAGANSPHPNANAIVVTAFTTSSHPSKAIGTISLHNRAQCRIENDADISAAPLSKAPLLPAPLQTLRDEFSVPDDPTLSSTCESWIFIATSVLGLVGGAPNVRTISCHELVPLT